MLFAKKISNVFANSFFPLKDGGLSNPARQFAWRPSFIGIAFFALFFFAAGISLFAQPEGVALRHYTTDDGLSHNFITGIARDTQGFMWFGTVDGLTRFDGKRCTVFRPREGDTSSLPFRQVNGLSLDPLGRLWITTGRGICIWDYVDRHFHRVPLYAPGQTKPILSTSTFYFDKNGFGWAVGDTFLIRMDCRTLRATIYPTPQNMGGTPSNFVDSKGRVWMSVAGNVFRFFPETASYEFQLGRMSPDPAKRYSAGAFAEDEHGRVWCSTWGGGLFKLNEETGKFEDYPDGPAITTVILFDRHPVAGPIVWAGGGVHGLYWLTLLEKEDVQFPLRPKEPFSHNNTLTRCIFKDTLTNIVWIGTDGGVEKYDPNDLKFTRIMLPDTIAPDQFSAISGIVPDPNVPDRYWISIWGKGLIEWDRRRKEFQTYNLYNKSSGHPRPFSDEIFDIISDKHGKIWLAELKTVEEFDPVTKRFRTFRPNFPTQGINHKVLNLLEGRDGRIWFGSNYEGLYWLDPASGHMEYVPLDGKKRYVRALKEDSKGRILIGDSAGFLRYDPSNGRYEHLLQTDSINYGCNDFAFDRQNRLWVATFDGLYCLNDSGRVTFSLTTRNGLQNNVVNAIEIDREDRLWLGTGNGLHRFYPPTGRIDVYHRMDGLFDNDISGAFRMLPNGELFIGFQDAFNLANTSHLPLNPAPPRLALTDVAVLNKPVPWRMGEPVVLQPGENVVTFDFSVLSYTQPEKTLLAYKLEGFDPDWVETRQNIITYTNLDGGNYTLLVKARNGDGFWSREIARVPVHVIPPFRKTIWFRLLILAIAGGLIGLIAWYRQEQRLQLEKIRRRIARDLHDDMGSTLSSIRFFSEVAQTQLGEEQAPTKTLLQRIGQSAASLSEAMQDIVWAINARYDNLDDLAARMREFGVRIGEARSIRFVDAISPTFSLRHLRPDQRRNIYLIFKEAMNNATKYSECSEISVHMELVRSKLILEIKDDGKGFDPQTVQAGNGLTNMRQRAAEIGGELVIKAAPGSGVQILLTVEV